MANCDHRSGRRRAIALLLPALVLGGPSAGCRVIPSSSLRPPSAASTSRYEAGRGGAGDDVRRAQYVPSSEATPARDPPPEADPVEVRGAVFSGRSHRLRAAAQPAAPTDISPGRGGSRRRGNRLRTLLARVRARFGFSGFDTGRITPQEKTIVMTLLFIASCPSCRTITLAPKKLIRTRRASEGSASRALARASG